MNQMDTRPSIQDWNVAEFSIDDDVNSHSVANTRKEKENTA